MMDLVITPGALGGTLTAPSSKSMGHRELICAALAEGESTVDNVTVSEDIEATCRILQLFGAQVEEIPSQFSGRTCFRVRGGMKKMNHPLIADCGESGSTLRFAIPVGLMSGNDITYTGRGRLVQRPLQPYYDLFDKHHISYETQEGGLPLTVRGMLKSGIYELQGDVSSQFFTGLLLALPLTAGTSIIRSTTKLESESYIGMTVDCLQRHGIEVGRAERAVYAIAGGQKYKAGHYVTEGDYSQAAFWLTAGTLGHTVQCQGLSDSSSQGDKAILSIIRRMGGCIETGENGAAAHPADTSGIVVDAADCPDLVPIVTVLAACSQGTTQIINAARLRLKECDRLHAIASELNKLGANVQEKVDGLQIRGVGQLHGGRVHSWNDHRIAMALAVASQKCDGPVTIEGAECVRKSYPAFWHDFAGMGGRFHQEG